MKKDNNEKFEELKRITANQNIASFELNSKIQKKHYVEAYALLLKTYPQFDFDNFNFLEKKSISRKENFYKAREIILINNISVSDSEFRSIDSKKFKKSQSYRFNIFFNPNYKNKDKIDLIKALYEILRLWKTIAKKIAYNSDISIINNSHTKKKIEKNNELKQLSIRLSNKFDIQKIVNIIANVTDTNVNKDSEGYHLMDANLNKVMLIEPVSKNFLRFKLKSRSRSLSYERPVYKRADISSRAVKIVTHGDLKDHPETRTLSLDDRIQDDVKKNPSLFKRYLLRSITSLERCELSFENEAPLTAFRLNQETISELKTDNRFSKLFKGMQSKEIVEVLKKNPGLASFLLVNQGLHKFFLCCSDTLKNNIPITSNAHSSFTKNGNLFTDYIDSTGKIIRGYEIEGGGELLIDAAFIPHDQCIIAPRAHSSDEQFIHQNTNEEKSIRISDSQVNKIRTVSYRNHEVHIKSLPRKAIIAWRANPHSQWLQCIPKPYIKNKDTNEIFEASEHAINEIHQRRIKLSEIREAFLKDNKSETLLSSSTSNTRLIRKEIRPESNHKRRRDSSPSQDRSRTSIKHHKSSLQDLRSTQESGYSHSKSSHTSGLTIDRYRYSNSSQPSGSTKDSKYSVQPIIKNNLFSKSRTSRTKTNLSRQFNREVDSIGKTTNQ